MDPNIVNTAGWEVIGNAITKLAIFVALMIIGAFSMLLARGVIPSLILTEDVSNPYVLQRRALHVVGIVAFVLAIVQFARVVAQLLTVLNPLFPRFGF